jgi:hypothetical protein
LPASKTSKNTHARRPYYGGGMPKGHKTRKTLAKEAAREILRARVLAELDPLIQAQIKNALEVSFLVVRDTRNGKFLRVAESMAKAQLGTNEELIQVWAKDPNLQAFTDLMDRALDKPRKQEQDVRLNLTEENALIARLEEARRRVNWARA